MPKLEKIQEAYGEYWEKLKDSINMHDGYIEGYIINKKLGFTPKDYEEKFAPLVSSYRPKSLQGIEHNNGWIKIESEEDLPEETGIYFTFSKVSWKPFYRIDVFTGRLKNSFTNGISCFTHYQPIIKPEPPMY